MIETGRSHLHRGDHSPSSSLWKLHGAESLHPARRQIQLVAFLALLFVAIWKSPPPHIFQGVASYAWLHLTLEVASILVAGMVFGVAWNSYSKERPGNIIILAVGLVGVGIIDFVHALSFAGMPDLVTPSGPEKAINFWLAARLLFALLLTWVAIRSWEPLRWPALRHAGLAAALAVAALVVWTGLFHQDKLPRTFIAGQGLTSLKIGMEYLVVGILAIPTTFFLMRVREPQVYDVPSLFAAAAISILSELSFTLYSDVTDIFNLLGHIYKVIAFVMIYRAVFVGSVREPFERVVKAEEKVRASSRYMRSLLEASLDPMFVMDRDGKLTDLNQAAEDATGLDRRELLGRDFAECFAAPDMARRCFETVLAKGAVRDCALTIRHVSGSGMPVLYNATAYYNDEGERAGIYAAARDVTEIRKAQAALEQQHALLSKITDTSPIGITLWDAGGHILFANPKAEQVLGYSKATLRHLAYDAPEFHITDLSGKPIPQEQLPFRRVVDSGEAVYEAEMAIAGPDERRVLLAINASPLRNAAGALEGVVATLEDITQRRADAEKLLASEQRLKLAMSAAHMGAWSWDVKLDQLDYSQETAELLGLSKDRVQLKRDDFLELLHPADRTRVSEELRSAMTRENAYWVDFRVPLNDGSVRWLSTHGTVGRDCSGTVAKVAGMVIDVTDKKQGEIALQRANRALRSLSAANERLIHARTESELINSVCRVIVEVGGYRFAWVGMALNDDLKTVEPVAQFGDDSDFLKIASIVWADAERGRGPTGTAIRTGMTQIDQNFSRNPKITPWRGEALQRGFHAGIAFPLSDASGVYGSMTIYSDEQDAFNADEVRLLQELADDLAFGIATLRMAEDHQHHEARLRASLVESIQAIAATLELRDPYTAGHQRRVAALATAIAHELGLSEQQVQGLNLAASIHDVGKIHIPSEILNKPGKISSLELELIKTHAGAGYDILKDIRFPWPIARIVHEHHEHLDGSGYPGHLKADQILIESKILTVADVVEAMTSHRPYRAGLGLEVALNHIQDERGTWYEPRVVDACLKLFNEGRYKFDGKTL